MLSKTNIVKKEANTKMRKTFSVFIQKTQKTQITSYIYELYTYQIFRRNTF